MTSVIAADGLTKWYGPRLAVDHVSVEVEAGEVMGLLGPNGSGKDDHPPDPHRLPAPVGRNGPHRRARRGRRCPRGTRPGRLRPRGRAALRGHAGWEFLAFMARPQGAGADRRRRDPSRSRSERLRLGPSASSHRQALASGFRQRVADRPGPPQRPALLILDEPTNGLDPQPDHRDARAHPLAGRSAHRLRHLAHPGRDRERRRPGGHPPRRPAARRSRPRRRPATGQRIRLRVRGAQRRVAPVLARRPRCRASLVTFRGPIARQPRDVTRLPRCDAVDGTDRRPTSPPPSSARARPRRHGAGAGGSRGGCSSSSPWRPGPRAAVECAMRVRHAPRSRRNGRSSRRPSPTPLVAVFLLLMGYIFTAILFLNKTGQLDHIFFQAAVLLLLIVPVLTMRLLAEERRGGHPRAVADRPSQRVPDRPGQVRRRAVPCGADARALDELRRRSSGCTATRTGARSTLATSASCSWPARWSPSGLSRLGLTANQLVAAVIGTGHRSSCSG